MSFVAVLLFAAVGVPAIVGIWIIVHAVSASKAASNVNQTLQARADKAVRGSGVRHCLIADDVILGISPDQTAIYKESADGKVSYIPLSSVRSVELTPIWNETIETTGETRTSRGSQIVSAWVGAALAGPVGALIGGVTARTTSSSTSTTSRHLEAMELKIRLARLDAPVLILNIGQKAMIGTIVPKGLQSTAESFAAVLANALDDNASSKGVGRSRSSHEPLSESSVSPTQPQLARGWWQRTFSE